MFYWKLIHNLFAIGFGALKSIDFTYLFELVDHFISSCQLHLIYRFCGQLRLQKTIQFVKYPHELAIAQNQNTKERAMKSEALVLIFVIFRTYKVTNPGHSISKLFKPEVGEVIKNAEFVR